MLDAGRGLETAGADERPEPGVEAVGLVAAAPQRIRQPALDPAGGDAGDGVGEPPVGAHREAGEHVVLGEPARPAGALDHERPRLAVGRAETLVVVRRQLDAGHHGDVEARFIEHHDDVRQLAAGSQAPVPVPVDRRSAASASNTPRVAGRPPRPRPSARTWRRNCRGQNSSSRSVGTANDSPASAAKHRTHPATPCGAVSGTDRAATARTSTGIASSDAQGRPSRPVRERSSAGTRR